MILILEKEDVEYTDSIQSDIKWLGFDWEDRLYHASDYYQQLFDFAKQLIRDGKAYVDHLSADEIRDVSWYLDRTGQAESASRSNC